jgi:hypothetical protein
MLTPGGSSTAHLHTNSTQNTENGTYITIKTKTVKCGSCPVCELYPGICLTTEVKHGNLPRYPDGSSEVRIYTQNSTQNTEDGTRVTITRGKKTITRKKITVTRNTGR